jgi:glycosyltransferase involved in cell wall biosynthesis
MPQSNLGRTRRRIHLLMFNACGGGGVARSVINLANHLADSNQVELISLYRRRDAPRFTVDPRVRLTFLADARRHGPVRARLDRRRTRLRPEPTETEMSLLTDLLLWRKLNRLRPGILVSTRPSLHLAAARLAPRRLATIGWDHLNFPTRFQNDRQANVLRFAVPRLDAYTVLTNADAEDYRSDMPGMDTRLAVIRNAIPWPVSATPARLENKVVVAAGRLSAEKGFRRLLRAYEPIARSHPDWQLHIYGHGEDQAALGQLITRRGIDEQVRLKGYTDDLRSVLAESSVYAMSSHLEGFPMVLIEAMSTGLPLVGFDCPRGPGEIIDDGKNGHLVRDGDLAGFTSALRGLIEDHELRRRLGARALEDAGQYETDQVLTDWEELFEQLDGRRDG